jgi:teichuronic acid biosynthesis glycosyltransferase TuaG
MIDNDIISIIVTVYDEDELVVIRAIESVLFQENVNLELIVIIDSPDRLDLKIKLERFLKERKKSFHVIINEINLGPALSRNLGLKKTSGKFIAFIDGDDEYLPGKLIAQMEAMQNNPSIDVLFTAWNEIDVLKNLVTPRVPKHVWFKDIKKNFFIKPMLLHASMMCRADIIKKFNYPDVRRGEDFGLYLEMISKNVSFHLIDGIYYSYYVTKSNHTLQRKKIHKFSYDFLGLLKLHLDNYKFNLYFWIKLLRTLFEWVFSYNTFVYFSIYYPIVKFVRLKTIIR